MSGHNKWSKIKNKKGSEDARRGKIFTKLNRIISVAVREGGDNPEYNPALKAAIDKAKAENMPNDNIERAIKKASGSTDGANFERVIYEGYAKDGVAVIVDCLTDNKNRTAPDIRHLFDKFGGNLGTDGSVMFMFNRKGIIEIDKDDSIDFDELMLEAIEFGAEDVEEDEDVYQITTSVDEFQPVVDKFKEAGYKLSKADLSYIADNLIEAQESNLKQIAKLIENLEDNDDVQEVYTNWKVPEDLGID
ncbi:YebC/PmpR family DNA-binding transcriptional regulator [Anaerococcus sp. AGMB00486]|uniref:Probable transcriptional regulatory protein HV819_08355 n=2 Tax=Anaerococcus TaxID=165779 RepID=A0ABX2NBC1_9FIRM|nr:MULTISPECIES: YebC/PmpR family DNA-binding transcriptional regulator [Anaerococcus]MDY3005509.1 YebC/PmpR family DNA-binding transcriptional regulator [Anaerococcus porci]MSS78231.1 YebC/PmpR family DNA-binding transcriptional regulator [Anaerococcus porci]NVF11989.1 YebC/PmpR family DNA-binding transcriptional regulator [Anaerococcus faecalis]